jgi:hypothetical protein
MNDELEQSNHILIHRIFTELRRFECGLSFKDLADVLSADSIEEKKRLLYILQELVKRDMIIEDQPHWYRMRASDSSPAHTFESGPSTNSPKRIQVLICKDCLSKALRELKPLSIEIVFMPVNE